MTRILMTLLLVALVSGQFGMIVSTGRPPRQALTVPCWSHQVVGLGSEATVEDEVPTWSHVIVSSPSEITVEDEEADATADAS